MPAAQGRAQFSLPQADLDFGQVRTWIEATLPADILLVLVVGVLLPHEEAS